MPLLVTEKSRAKQNLESCKVFPEKPIMTSIPFTLLSLAILFALGPSRLYNMSIRSRITLIPTL